MITMLTAPTGIELTPELKKEYNFLIQNGHLSPTGTMPDFDSGEEKAKYLERVQDYKTRLEGYNANLQAHIEATGKINAGVVTRMVERDNQNTELTAHITALIGSEMERIVSVAPSALQDHPSFESWKQVVNERLWRTYGYAV